MNKPGKSFALFSDAVLADAGDTAPVIATDATAPLPADAPLGAGSPAPDFCQQHLWLALRFYDLPLEVLCQGQTFAHPLAVVTEQHGKSVVVACNQHANDAGVQTGMALAAAYALAPKLELVSQHPAQEQAVLKRLAGWAKKYTPLVSLQAPDAVLLEIKGSLALFGGIEGLVQQVQRDIHALGFQHYRAIAPTPMASLWLCRQHSTHVAQNAVELNTVLGELPVACTGWPPEVLSRLQGMGIRRLRDCMRLPRDGFARRMGKQRLLELDRALGKAPDPRDNYIPPERYVARREFLFALEKLAMILHGLEQLLKELVGFLCGRQCGIQRLRIRMYHQDAAASVIELGMAGVCRDEKRLAALVHQKLEQLTLPEPVVAVTMVSGLLYPLAGRDGELFDDAAHEVHWPELVEKLRARLGVRAVTGVCLVPEHRPEQAWKYAEPGTSSEAWPHQRRPLWVLSAPCRMPLRQGQPHWQGVLTRVQGPERIESGWWDGQDVARDYFVATNASGLCLWIYRERARGHWYLHGIFA